MAGMAEAAVVRGPEVTLNTAGPVTRTAMTEVRVPRNSTGPVIRNAMAVIRMAAPTRPLPVVRPTGPRVTECTVHVVTGQPVPPGPVATEHTAAPETAEHPSRSRAHLHD